MLQNQPFFLVGSESDNHAYLLLHGLGGGVYEMQLLGEYLHQNGMTVQGIQYPGHDRPAPKMPDSTWQDWYGHSLESYHQLTQTYERVSIIGFSTGCVLGLHLAAQHPVHKLVLLSPYLLIRRYWFTVLPLEAYVFSLGYWLQDIPRLGLPIRDPIMQAAAQQVVFFHTFNLKAVRSAIALIDQVKTELPQIQNPSLIIQSKRDSVVDPSGAMLLYEKLESDEKQLHWLERSDHVITLDVEREQVFAAIGEFLRNS